MRVLHSPRSVLAALLLALLLPLAAPAAKAQASTDDYPWKNGSTTASDAFKFTQRQCVSYAAWRLYKAGHRINNKVVIDGKTYYWGNALNWDSMAQRLRKPIRTYGAHGNAAPRVGAIAHWNQSEASPWWSSTGGRGTFRAGSYGHVAVVYKVYSDGSVLVRQYNVNPKYGYSTMRVKAPRYLMI